MCLAIPGRILDMSDDQALRMGRVAFGPVIKEVCLAYVPTAQIDDYVIVHVGFAISRLDEEEAQRVFADFERAAPLDSQGEATP
jgi:hydrogenase expression/formation protein HypC